MCACLFKCSPSADAAMPKDACFVCDRDMPNWKYAAHTTGNIRGDLNLTHIFHKRCIDAWLHVRMNGPDENVCGCEAMLDNRTIVVYSADKEKTLEQIKVDQLFLNATGRVLLGERVNDSLLVIRALLAGYVSRELILDVLEDTTSDVLIRVLNAEDFENSLRKVLREKIIAATRNPAPKNMADLNKFMEQSKKLAQKSHDSLDDLSFDAFMMICAGNETSPDLLNWVLEGNKWGKRAINWAIFHLARLGKVDALQALILQEGEKATARGVRFALQHAQENCKELLRDLNPDPDSKE